ncbi:MAG: response regulator transcription factor [Chthoniobacteraceae bacterium]
MVSARNSSKRRPVFIVADRPLCRHGMAEVIRAQRDMMLVGEAEDGPAAVGALKDRAPAAAVIDVSATSASTEALVKSLHSELPDLPLLVVGTQTEPVHALRVLRAGAKGFITKREGLEQFVAALRKVMESQVYLSPVFSEQLITELAEGADGPLRTAIDRLSEREIEVLRLLGEGLATRATAERLGLSVKTVETHRARIKEKLGLRTAAELMRFAIQWTAEK